jgi:hypothetical protein
MKSSTIKPVPIKSGQGSSSSFTNPTTKSGGRKPDEFSTTKKRCIPGFVCIENITLLVLIGIFVLMVFFYNNHFSKVYHNTVDSVSKIIVIPPPPIPIALGGLSTRTMSNDILNDPYVPPLKRDDYFLGPQLTNDIRGLPSIIEEPVVRKLPINVETRGIASDYSQMGILTKADSNEDEYSTLILPLMGRRIMTGRDKWQYYSISNTGTLNTKLPIKVQGRSCTSEYGCDPIMDGDVIFVEGYKHKFKATIYENNLFSYIPVL